MDSGTWSVIGTNFDPDEETANFGTRHALEADGTLFDVFTYATIDPKGEVISNPNVISGSSQTKLALTLDSCLHVFEEDFRPDKNISLGFSSYIDTIAWTPCRRFLLMGLRSGLAQLVHLASGKPLPPFSLCVSEVESDEPKFVGSSCHGLQSNCNMQLISRDGKIFQLTGVDLDGLHDGLSSNDFAKLANLRNAIQSSEDLIRFEENFRISTTKIFNDEANNEDVIVAFSGGRLSRLRKNQFVDILDLSDFNDSSTNCDIQTIQVPKVTSRRNVAFCVDTNGRLLVVCLQTMMVISEWNKEKVTDFVLLEDEGDSVLKMMMVTQRFGQSDGSGDKNVRTFLQIREYPSFNVLYELGVSPFCRLLDTGINQENPMILEGSSSMNKGLVSGLRIRGICEGSAEARLTRLLRRKKFDEAENFAKIYRLPLEEVHQARAASLMEQLSPWKVSGSSSLKDDNGNVTSLFEALRKTLLSMSDLKHMVRCCIEAAMPSLELTKELLILARTAIQNNTDQDLENSLMGRVCQTLHRLQTFTFIGNSSNVKQEARQDLENVNAWINFSRVEMLDECRLRLSEGHLKAALLIWKRHQAEFSRTLSCDLIRDILSEMNTRWSVDTKLEWLSQFLPDCLNILPDCLPVVAKWTVEATKALEMSERKQWPGNGLNFATSVLETLLTFGNRGNVESGELTATKVLLMLHQQRTDQKSDFYMLTRLIETLNDLKILHESFRFRIKLADFDIESKSEVSALILDWFQSADEVDVVLKKFLLNFMEKTNLDPCQVLAQYAKSLLENSGFCWYWEVGSAPWEEKVAMLLTHIKASSELRSKIVLQCLQSAPVPWSETIQQICLDGKKSASPEMAILIGEEEKMVVLKQILRKYECTSFAAPGRESERLLQCIIKRGAELEEVLQVSQFMNGIRKVDAVKFYIERQIQNDNHIMALEIFRQTEDIEEIIILSQKMLIHAELTFRYWQPASSTNIGDVKDLLPVVLFLKGASTIVQRKKGIAPEFVEEFVQSSDKVCRQFSILREFGMKTSDTDLVEPKMSANVRNLIEKDLSDSDVIEPKTLHKRLQRMSQHFNYPYESCLGQLLLALADKKMYSGYVKSVEEIIVARSLLMTPDMARFVLKSLSALHRNLLETDHMDGDEIPFTELLSSMQNLSSISVSVCHDSQLAVSVFASKIQSYLGQLQKQFHDQRVFSNVNLSVDNYSQARYTPMFQDKGLPLDPSFLKIPVEYATAMIDSTCESLEYLPNLTFCRQEEEKDDDGVRLNQLENLRALLRRHSFDLGSLGHSALPLFAVRMFELPLISYSLNFGVEFAHKMLTLLQEDLATTTKNVVPKILSERKPDLYLALGFLLSTEPATNSKVALKIMMSAQASFGTDFRKVSTLGRLGMRFCCLKLMNKLSREFNQFKMLCVKSIWGRRVEEIGVSVNVAKLFSNQEKDHLQLLADLVDKSIVDPAVQFCVDDLHHFARAFDLEEDTVRTNFVRWCVSSTALEPVINAGTNLVEKPAKFDEIIEQIDKAFCINFLNGSFLSPSALMPPFFHDVSPYNYEVLQLVVGKWRTICENSIPDSVDPESQMEDAISLAFLELEKTENILGFLINYKRCNPPSEDEVDKWLKKFLRPFPKIGHIRLPLHYICELSPRDSFKFVTREFQLVSYKAWIESSRVLRFKEDNIRILTVQNAIQALTQSATHSDTDGWNLASLHGAVLEEIKNCLMDASDLFKAASAASATVNRLPRGVDKLFAARLSTQITEMWHEEGKDNEVLSTENGLVYAYQTQLKLEVENILAKFGLLSTTSSIAAGIKIANEQQFLDLIHQGKYEDLIMRMFEHDSIAERNQFVVGEKRSGGSRYPDINGAVTEIAELSSHCKAAEEFGINPVKLTKLKYRLLDQWLPEKVAHASSMDETITNFDFLQNMNHTEGGASDEIGNENAINFLRCVYIFQGCECYDYMISIAYSPDPMLKTMHKLRALKCMLSVVCSGHKDLEGLNLNEESDIDIEQHLQALVFVARLEKLNLSYDLRGFINCKKPALIESLLRSCGHLPDGLSLIIDLCLAYDVFPPSLWSALLKQMCRLGLTTHLRRVLSELNRHPTLWHLPAFLDAWNKVLSDPFSSASTPVNAECRRSCQKSIELLEHCPIASDVNIQVILGECKRLKLDDLSGHLLEIADRMKFE